MITSCEDLLHIGFFFPKCWGDGKSQMPEFRQRLNDLSLQAFQTKWDVGVSGLVVFTCR